MPPIICLIHSRFVELPHRPTQFQRARGLAGEMAGARGVAGRLERHIQEPRAADAPPPRPQARFRPVWAKLRTP